MAIDGDDEILQDFLIEAGEILELLGEQLVDLERKPQDSELLNAIFRGFHTVKGGAGFLGITSLVEICHCTEDVFNLLRQGSVVVDAGIMDIVLRSLDSVNEMFDGVRGGQEPAAADTELLQQLRYIADHGLAPGGNAAPAVSQAAVAEAASPAAVEAEAKNAPAPDDDFTDLEFQALLDAAANSKEATAAESAPPPSEAGEGDITEDEFEALLDELHGKGKFSAAGIEAAPEPQPVPGAPTPPPAAADDDEITDDEFEALLDELHGQGKFGADLVAAIPNRAVADKKTSAKAQGKPAPKVAAGSKPTAKPASQPAPRPATPRADTTAQSDSTIRVDTKRLDEIMNMVGELVLVRNRLATLRSKINDEQVAKAIANLDLVTSDLQLAAMKTRMQPIKKVFGRFPRVVRDLARHLNKEIDLEMQGEETDLDKNLVEALADPLVHLVRNSVDHGIELPEVRVKAGKSPKGTVVLAAEQAGDHILLSIEDDGAGMDPERLRAKVVEKGLMDEEAAKRLTDRECYNLIFLPGFSTKSEISDVSGRGVGMDVVKTRIGQLNGTVEIDSELGRGSRISIKVPLTLAILPTLMVRLQDQAFAIPLSNVNEIFDLDLSRTKMIDGQEVVMLRGKALPVFYLKEWLIRAKGTPSERPSSGHVVVVQVSGRLVGFVVDHLLGQEEVVIKPLGAFLQKISGLAGATITGDGRMALILDVPSLLKAYAGRRGAGHARAKDQR
ncbi:MAG: chemotaxis protein CheA [Proteobacteria bacterium]|nr:MAG: chemotaxis protein CheA [Pseudomonadota bacterium]